jgi:hypothetical protein
MYCRQTMLDVNETQRIQNTFVDSNEWKGQTASTYSVSKRNLTGWT